ncbi:unnamed protein product, partial [Durusdinium trenchii]
AAAAAAPGATAPSAVARAAQAAAEAAGGSAQEAFQQASEAVTRAEVQRGKSSREVGMAARQAVADFSDPLHAKSLALRAAIQAVVRRNALHHDSPNLMAREAHLAAHAVGLPYDHLKICEIAVEALAERLAAEGATAHDLGVATKDLALSLAISPPGGLNSTTQELLSLQSAMFLASKAAARAALRHQMKEKDTTSPSLIPGMLQQAIFQAKQAARATGHPLGEREMAHLVGKTVIALSLEKGETYTLPQILKTAIDALNPSPEETRAAAAAAAKEVARAEALDGENPALIRKKCLEVLRDLPQGVIGPVKDT